MTTVLIADESVLLREGLAAVLEREGMTVAAKVATADALLEAVAAVSPDLVLVGIPMPAGSTDEGLPAAELIARRHPGVGVLVLSGSFDPALAMRLLSGRSARAGYLLKDAVADMSTLLDALRVVAAGGTFVDRAVIERLRATGRGEPMDRLSDREREILALMAEGRTNRGISSALFLSPKTVESHVRTIFSKLDLRPAPDDHRRVLAVLRYLEAGAGAPPAAIRLPGVDDRRGAGESDTG